MPRRAICPTLLAFLLLLSLVAVATVQQPKSGGTLRVAWEADITGMDPHLSPGIQSWHVVGNLFNSLLTIDTELNYVPDLAESWRSWRMARSTCFTCARG